MVSNRKELLEIISDFLNEKKVVEIIELSRGHINDSYIIKMPNYQYILQRINTNVFTRPFGMMNNIYRVTKHIKYKVIYEGENPQKAVLNVVRTKYGELLSIKDGEYWRMVEFINDSESYDNVTNKEVFYEMGKIVGRFQNLLNNFPSRILDDSISHFHDTKYRYENFLKTISVSNERINSCIEEIEFFKSHSEICGHITNLLKKREIPERVSHNDTKPNNILFDVKTKKALCMIDLDTVMKGSLLYDYGDAIRFGASTALEDETDLDKVGIDFELFESFTEGFLLEMKPKENELIENSTKPISKEEIRLLYDGYHIITIELAMRFLVDYLLGDIYFRIDKKRPQHNLERARNQMKLVTEIEANEKKLKEIINKILIKLEYDPDNLIQID